MDQKLHRARRQRDKNVRWQPIDPVTRTFTMTDFETGQRLGYSIDRRSGDQSANLEHSTTTAQIRFLHKVIYMLAVTEENSSASQCRTDHCYGSSTTQTAASTHLGDYTIQTAAVADGIVFFTLENTHPTHHYTKATEYTQTMPLQAKKYGTY